MTLPSIYLVHSSEDKAFANGLRHFLETGCDVRCLTGGQMASSEELFDRVEEGLGGATILVLSESASPQHWPRARWEPLLVEQNLAVVLMRDCQFPALLRRRNFFDATVDSLSAMRGLKRWFWCRIKLDDSFGRTWSKDLGELYASVADSRSCVKVDGSLAERFVQEAEHEFASILWVSCYGRTLAQAAGDLAAQLGIDLTGTTAQNCGAIRLQLLQQRYLLVLDAPEAEHLDALSAESGRTSMLITNEPTRLRETAVSLPFARELMMARRFAEAYELYRQLMDLGAEKADCARDLIWICEQWDWLKEADSLRPDSVRRGEQMSLFC